MEQFSARGFFYVGLLIEGIKTECLVGSIQVDPTAPIYNFAAELDEKVAQRALDYLPRIERECRSIGLRMSAEAVSRAIKKLGKRAEIAVNYQWLRDEVSHLKELIASEMSQHGFFYISADRGKYWTKPDESCPFGDAVANAFPSALFDIHGAGVCLAIGIGTPSVFHLMRALEFGLAALGSVFNVSLAHTNWEPAIREIESRIREMHKDPAWKAKSDCKTMQEKYSQAATHFATLKDAWRNYTMHGRGRYSDYEAEMIFLNVKGFMQKLAGMGLKEEA
jgi:hypothetical protein